MTKYTIVHDAPYHWTVYKRFITPPGQLISNQPWPVAIADFISEQEAIDFVLMRKLEE